MKNELPKKEIMYKALVEKDSSFEGIFYAAIKTTGIFCKPTCRARKPHIKNVEFFASTDEAINNGYRPCKICKPTDANGKIPSWIKEILQEVENNNSIRWTDEYLMQHGVDPNRVRRWFKKNYNLTFHSYVRKIRLGEAINKIGKGEKMITTAYDHGYESLSGFIDGFKKLTGSSPGKSKELKTLSFDKIQTPLGNMIAAAIDDELVLLEFEDRRMLKTQLKRITYANKAIPIMKSHPLFKEVEIQINNYFEGKLKLFDLPIKTTGTKFQKEVWDELIKIPYGETICYEELAKRIENPAAVRAVASANGYNSIAIVIPCHRVIGKDGALRGYGGKVWRKKRLLELENGERVFDL